MSKKPKKIDLIAVTPEMSREEILHNLEEARDSQDWEMVDTCIETIRVLIDDYDEYNSEEDWG